MTRNTTAKFYLQGYYCEGGAGQGGGGDLEKEGLERKRQRSESSNSGKKKRVISRRKGISSKKTR